MANFKNTTIQDTGAFQLPTGSTEERPENPNAGYIRYNTGSNIIEVYNGENWINFVTGDVISEVPIITATGGTVTEETIDGQLYKVHTFTGSGNFTITEASSGSKVDVFAVGGGGGGATHYNLQGIYSGGGGGGYTNTFLDIPVQITTYNVIIGAGGQGGPSNTNTFGPGGAGGNGTMSYFLSSDYGSAGGFGPVPTTTENAAFGGDGGSRGGNAFQNGFSDGGGSTATPPGGQGTTTRRWGLSGEQLFSGGGSGSAWNSPYYGGDGGGGAGSGRDWNNNFNTITGNGATNSGGGGGGRSTFSNAGPAGNGGSGIIAIRYKTGTSVNILNGSTAEKAAPSTQYLIDNGITTDGLYYIDLPTVGATQVYCDLTNGGWVMVFAGGEIQYGHTSTFWDGTLNSNVNFTYKGTTFNTSMSEKIIKNMPFSQMRVTGQVWADQSNTSFNASDGYPSPVIYESSVSNTTFAQKKSAATSWTSVNSKGNSLQWNRTDADGYSRGDFLLAVGPWGSSSYGDFGWSFIGGSCRSVGNFFGHWFVYPSGTDNCGNGEGCTSSAYIRFHSLGRQYHRYSESYVTDALWFKA